MTVRPLPAELKKQMQKSLLRYSDMPAEMAGEISDVAVSAIDKFSTTEEPDLEAAARLVKETLDKQYGPLWHCAMGKGFSFDVTAEVSATNRPCLSDWYTTTLVLSRRHWNSYIQMLVQLNIVSSYLLRMFRRYLCSLTRCEDLYPEEHFGVSVPLKVKVGSAPFARHHVAVSAAPRCMHDLCWLPPARAYVLGTMINEHALNRARVAGVPAEQLLSVDTEKTFLFVFAGAKDAQHVRRGFGNSLRWAGAGETAEKFASLVSGAGLQKGDRLHAICFPLESRLEVRFESSDGKVRQTTAFTGDDALRLINALHRLYLSQERYPSIAEKITSQTRQALLS